MDRMPRRIVAVVVSLWMALLPAALASTAMAMSQHMQSQHAQMADNAGAADCDCCEDAQADGIACVLMCMSAWPAMAILEQRSVAPAVFGRSVIVSGSSTLIESRNGPDPPPPRP